MAKKHGTAGKKRKAKIENIKIPYTDNSEVKEPDEIVRPGAHYFQTLIVLAVIFVAAIIFMSIKSKIQEIKLINIKKAEAAASEKSPVAGNTPQPEKPPEARPTEVDAAMRHKMYFEDAATKSKICRIDTDDARYLFGEQKVLFVDAREPEEYKAAHIKGAINIPAGTKPDQLGPLQNKLKEKLLVIYCQGVGCHLSDKTAYMLYSAGYRKLVIFFGGWLKWKKYNYPIEAQK
jgi:rhodanese-related sulfurtransferase